MTAIQETNLREFCKLNITVNSLLILKTSVTSYQKHNQTTDGNLFYTVFLRIQMTASSLKLIVGGFFNFKQPENM